VKKCFNTFSTFFFILFSASENWKKKLMIMKEIALHNDRSVSVMTRC